MDIGWILELTAPNILRLNQGQARELELGPAVYRRTHALISKALAEGNHFTREDTLPGAEAAACLSIAAIDGAVPIACWRPMPRIDYDKGGWTRCLTLHSQK